jgi:IrrE N-terminal-like domain
MATRKNSDWARIIEHKIDRILSTVSDGSGRARPPIDLESLFANFRVVGVEERHMVPEAATEPTVGGFKVYLQDNFSGLSLTSSRRRFTLAHEFCHTLLYDWSTDVPTRIKGAPQGENVEALCHLGARLLLVPTYLLRREVQSLGGEVTAKNVPDLASKFEVSVDVVLRRVQDVIGPPVDRAVILVGPLGEDTRPHILASYSGPWLVSHFAVPKCGAVLEHWSKGASAGGAFLRGAFRQEVPGGRLIWSEPVRLRRGRLLLEVSIESEDIERNPAEKP